MYGVIRLKGRQYKVKAKDEILVDYLGQEKPEAETLLVVGEKGVKVGNPVVKDAKLKLKVIGDEKGEKILVSKYKAKSRYRKKLGFRAKYTRLQIESIS